MSSRNTPANPAPAAKKPIKLRQAQVWKQDGNYLRIVRLERLEVEYIYTTSPGAKKGIHVVVSKKEFCRLLKNATLLSLTNISPATIEADAIPKAE